MKITKNQLRQLIKEEIINEIGQVSDIDMEDLALIYDDEFGPDYVFGMLSSDFPTLGDDAVAQRVLGMLKDAARQGDVPVNYLARRLAKLLNR